MIHNVDGPKRAHFWCAVFDVSLPPLLQPLPLRTKVDKQRLFDLWHGLEDTIEFQTFAVMARRLRWMRRIELTAEANR